MVRIHPATGEKTLLLGHFFKEFVGLKPSESVALYQILQARIIKLENTVRWNWSAGDLAIWDNQATQHYGIADYGTQARSVHRVTLAGDVPVDVHGEQSRILQGDAAEYSIIADIDRLPGFAAN
ncbi:hypothetical protein G9444_4263 [Rhodococcus erythropolis]|uniref:TauD/TfdA-like domain-containing protein n=1 Tax=Rhodococcus erythropolis TaxID=1833 RepID=A0A6G9CWZ2_RHOER|nr:hypothetical protein G9444_4263 [Rhodococcus erythropolis]